MTPADRPSVVIIGGPNGAGKSTIAPRPLRDVLQVEEFVNADVIARGLSAFNPEGVAVRAGRVMLERLRELAAQRARFAFETTLASRSFAPWLRELTAGGYEFHCVSVWVTAADLCIQRIADRVSRGGHHVPDDVVRRRYRSGWRNFFDLYRPLATTWRVYDNSGDAPAVVAEGERESVAIVIDRIRWSQIEDAPGAPRWREAPRKREDLSRIGQIMLDGTAIDEAVRAAVRDAIAEHARDGAPIVIERDGKIVELPAEEILREQAAREARRAKHARRA